MVYTCIKDALLKLLNHIISFIRFTGGGSQIINQLNSREIVLFVRKIREVNKYRQFVKKMGWKKVRRQISGIDTTKYHTCLTKDTERESDKTRENMTYKKAKRSALSQQVAIRLQETGITVWQRQTQITKKIHKRNTALERPVIITMIRS